MLLFGTAQGSAVDPAWCFNLRANPEVDVGVAIETYRAEVIELSADEASAIVHRRAESTPQLADYITSAAPLAIPVFEINRYQCSASPRRRLSEIALRSDTSRDRT